MSTSSTNIQTLVSSLPKSLNFYDVATVELDQIIVDQDNSLDLDQKQVIAFKINGDFNGWFFILGDPLLDSSMLTELGNCLAAGFANRIADELTEISAPIYPNAKQFKRICGLRSMIMRAEYCAHWKGQLIPVQAWISGTLAEGEIRV